jgi:hypothetical protein
MAAALEERIMCEALDQNGAIDALKKEIEVLEVDKVRLLAEVGGLSTARADVENFCKEAEVLRK